MRISTIKYRNASVEMCVENSKDLIQYHHSIGYFYEVEELERIALCIPKRAIVLDVGANVGNHSVYFAKFCGASQVIPFEPNPKAYEILIENVRRNNLANISLDWLGKAVGSPDSGRAVIVKRPDNNLGGTSLTAGIDAGEGDESFDIISLDELDLAHVDFIKIDVEGMELSVLEGASETIRKFRPVIFVEVAVQNAKKFEEILLSLGYRIDQTFIRYRKFYNFLCVPCFLYGN